MATTSMWHALRQCGNVILPELVVDGGSRNSTNTIGSALENGCKRHTVKFTTLTLSSGRLMNGGLIALQCRYQFLAQDVNLIYTSRAYATMPVSICLSVCLWQKCIGALSLIWVSNSDPNLPRIAVTVHAGTREGIIAGKSVRIISHYASHC